MEFAVVDGTPIPKVLEVPCKRVSAATGLSLTSGYRGTAASGLLRRLGKMSQAELFQCDQNYRRTGRCHCSSCNPANPPGHSTHECYNDGVAYAGPSGRRLQDWQCGMDWSYGAGAVRVFNHLGYVASLTYPGQPREGQHVNLDHRPHTSIWISDPLSFGEHEARVKFLKYQLHYIHDPDTLKAYLLPGEHRPAGGWSTRFGPDLRDAVERFQHDHHQHVDGIVGHQTKRQLDVSYRHAKQRRQKKP